MNALTQTDIADLDRLEKIVEAGKQSFVDVGLALSEIRERRLFSRDYETFEAYCQERWGWSRKRGNQLIQAAAVVQALPKQTATMVATERAARELSKLPPEQRTEVVKTLKSEGKPVTAAAVKNFPPPPQSRPQPDLPRDKTGYTIPEKVLALYQRGQEVQTMLSTLSIVKGQLRRAQEDKDPLYAEVNFSSALSQLEQAWADIKTALPYAVCPTCQGRLPERCTLCKGRGFISEHRWSTCVPEETKNLRFKARR